MGGGRENHGDAIGAGVTGRWRGAGPPVVLLATLAAWLWPIGLGGRMPAGGDVTRFQIGLMAGLARALRQWRLPLWNDLWGYGFPAIGESQIGAFYPPHWVLYGLLPLEAAFTASLLLHTSWGALGGFWAARRFGVSPWGASLAALAWSASGFALVHQPHSWSYTSASWMPWAWGLAATLARSEGTRRDGWTLAAVLALQALPGHFQLAFVTQVGVAAIAAWGLISRRGAQGAGTIALATLAAGLLAAAQLVPSARLAALAAVQRDEDYLAEFAATPFHLVNLVAPRLFHVSPLWRPVAWDPFHTSPEENLLYLGLAPLLLALGAIGRDVRRDPTVLLLTALAAGTLLLALGRYVPGFGLLARLPGFSFFRAPARWELGTTLALAILSGKGFDALPTWTRPGRALGRFALGAIAAPALLILTFEAALASTERPGLPALSRPFAQSAARLPFGTPNTFQEAMAEARRPQADLRVLVAQARHGQGPVPAGGLRLDRERGGIYLRELGSSAGLVLVLIALIPLAHRRPKLLPTALLALTAADLLLLGRDRPGDDAPIRSLAQQSPVLARLAAEPPGTRVVDPLGNLPMVVGAAPLEYFRTIDLPALPWLARLADGPMGTLAADARTAEALRVAGASFRLFDPFASASIGRVAPSWNPGGHFEAIHDPALTAWTYGASWKDIRGANPTWRLWQAPSPTSRAWLLPTLADLSSANPSTVMTLFQSAEPLTWKAPDPEHLNVEIDGQGPGVVILSVRHDPEWRAFWNDDAPAEILPAFGGWMAVKVPKTTSGPQTLHLAYRGRDVTIGLAISAASLLASGIVIGFGKGRERR